MGVLLQFNNGPTHSLKDIADATGLGHDFLASILNLLTRTRVLQCNGPVNNAATVFKLNEDFKYKKMRVNLNQPIRMEQKAESEETHKTIEEDRKLVIQVKRKKKKMAILSPELIFFFFSPL
jgi:cullin 1